MNSDELIRAYRAIERQVSNVDLYDKNRSIWESYNTASGALYAALVAQGIDVRKKVDA